jgi:hypothetical protein
MSGTLTQLAAKGAQDRNLTVQPEITFFKGVWKHHTNYAMEAIEQEFTSGDAKSGSTATAEIPRSGDLVSDIWVKMVIAPILDATGKPFSNAHNYNVTYVDEIGHALIKKVKVEIGGHQFDAHTSEYLHCYHELSKKPGRVTDRLIGKFSDFPARVTASSEKQHLYVPLRFWFNETTSQALPLVALMYHQVKLQVEFRTKDEVITSSFLNEAVDATGEITPAGIPFGFPVAYDVEVGKPEDVAQLKSAAKKSAAGDVTIPAAVSDIIKIADSVAAHGQGPNGEPAKAQYYLDSANGDVIQSCKLLINYIFLDSVERKLFATMEHNYLIDTVQVDNPTYTSNNSSNSMSLMLNHPVKELIWVVRPTACVQNKLTIDDENDEKTTGRGTQRWCKAFAKKGVLKKDAVGGADTLLPWTPADDANLKGTTFCPFVSSVGGAVAVHNQNSVVKNFFNFTGPSPINTEHHAFGHATLKLNGHTRFENVKAPFLRTIQPAQYHSSTPKSMIYNYSFALDPEDWKPTGSINMSRIDTVKLDLHIGVEGATVPDSECFVFARSINIMKITSGMAGLKYAN